MKTIAFYLPQFHEIPENNDWWGTGFTEWTNVRRATPLYDGHRQPRVPADDNYYDLSSLQALDWQARLIEKYNIDGLCFYHYHFSGKLLLEKPAELVLQNKTINIPFMFCWANESWTRTWEGDEKKILIRQRYGDQALWVSHIEYLVNFFADPRYLKIDKRPVLLIYKQEEIECLQDMIKSWNNYLRSHDMGESYLIQVARNPSAKLNPIFDRIVKFEPFFSAHSTSTNWRIAGLLPKSVRSKLKSIYRGLRQVWRGSKAITFDYDKVWAHILSGAKRSKSLSSAFVDWDNTPRKPTSPTIFQGGSPEKFSKYFERLYDVEVNKQSPFLFINAWNEWAEGAYLEPDTANGHSYLEAIAAIKAKYAPKKSCE